MKPDASLDDYRTQGSAHFTKQQLHEAINAYEAAIWYYRAAHEVSILRLNASAAYLKIGLPGHALRQLEQCDKAALTPVQLRKLGFRKLTALYDLGRFVEADGLLRDMQDYEEPNVLNLKWRIGARLQETSRGPAAYDWSKVYKSVQSTGLLDVAEWTGPVVTKTARGRGRGLFATRDLAVGEVILVAQPMACVRPAGASMSVVLGINLVSGTPDAPSQVDVVGELLERAIDDPRLARQLEDIYAGHQYTMPGVPGASVLSAGSTSGLDAGQIEGMITYNSFKPESCLVDMLGEDDDDVLHSPSALYYLPSMVNHACLGNASYVFYGNLLVVRALKRISFGDEILFS